MSLANPDNAANEPQTKNQEKIVVLFLLRAGSTTFGSCLPALMELQPQMASARPGQCQFLPSEVDKAPGGITQARDEMLHVAVEKMGAGIVVILDSFASFPAKHVQAAIVLAEEKRSAVFLARKPLKMPVPGGHRNAEEDTCQDLGSPLDGVSLTGGPISGPTAPGCWVLPAALLRTAFSRHPELCYSFQPKPENKPSLVCGISQPLVHPITRQVMWDWMAFLHRFCAAIPKDRALQVFASDVAAANAE